jgi:hypothetical protein
MTEEKKEVNASQDAKPAEEKNIAPVQADTAGQLEQQEQEKPEVSAGSGQDTPAAGDVQDKASKEKTVQENSAPAAEQQKTAPAVKQQKQEGPEGAMQEQPKAEDAPGKSAPKPEVAVDTGKRKKINLMSLKELDNKLKSVKEKMGNLRSRYARQLLRQKEIINKQGQ